jgi:hypothetical protein
MCYINTKNEKNCLLLGIVIIVVTTGGIINGVISMLDSKSDHENSTHIKSAKCIITNVNTNCTYDIKRDDGIIFQSIPVNDYKYVQGGVFDCGKNSYDLQEFIWETPENYLEKVYACIIAIVLLSFVLCTTIVGVCIVYNSNRKIEREKIEKNGTTSAEIDMT